ncbi:MAG: CPBP family intramembrane glutamic endopeptidase [Desulfatiglandaceae bacterium]
METNAARIRVKPMILSIGMVACVETALRMLPVAPGSESMTALGLARLVQIFLLMAILGAGEGLPAMGLSFSGLRPGVKSGILWSLSIGGAVFMLIGLLRLQDVNLFPMIRVRTPPDSEGILLLFCVGGLAGPVAEELFFRGVVYGFVRRWGVPAAITASTLLFLLAHPDAFQKIPVIQGAGGILFAVAYEVKKNLMVPIVIHALGNMSLFLFSVFPWVAVLF